MCTVKSDYNSVSDNYTLKKLSVSNGKKKKKTLLTFYLLQVRNIHKKWKYNYYWLYLNCL